MIKNPQFVLYLDFDGPLHHDNVRKKTRIHAKTNTTSTRVFMAEPGRALFEFAGILEEILAPYPEVQIVLATSWVPEKRYSYAKGKLPASLQQRVIGATFHSKIHDHWEFTNTARGRQVEQDVNRRMPAYWLALDDDDQGWSELGRTRLITVDPVMGLGQESVQRQLRLALAQGREYLNTLSNAAA